MLHGSTSWAAGQLPQLRPLLASIPLASRLFTTATDMFGPSFVYWRQFRWRTQKKVQKSVSKRGAFLATWVAARRRALDWYATAFISIQYVHFSAVVFHLSTVACAGRNFVKAHSCFSISTYSHFQQATEKSANGHRGKGLKIIRG